MLDYGRKKAKAYAKEKGEIDLGQPDIVEDMVGYVMAKAPRALGKIGFSKSRVRELILERLE